MMKVFRRLGIAAVALLVCSGIASSQEPIVSRWQKLTHEPTFQTDQALLLTDGSVIMHVYNGNTWWRLIPDITGSYLNGTWVQTASMASNYKPLYFASAVLADGRLIAEGGEYNNLQQVETNLGSIYDPVANAWTAVTPPSGWTTIGDSPAVVLADGTFMMGQGGQPATRQVILNASTLTWTAVGTGKADGFSEEGLALVPDGSVLTVDCEHGTNSELYDPLTAKWTSAGSTIATLPNSGGLGIVPEMGPLVQRPDGTVVAFGATTHTSIFDTTTGTWTQGPDYPSGDDMADGPAAILPDGNILAYTSPGVFSGTGTFYEFSTTNTFTKVASTSSGTSLQSWEGRLLLLPTGQILYAAADGRSIDVELYTSKGTVNAAWAPTITSVPTTLTHGISYTISGTQFNGLSAGGAYGDDATFASNYPLVRIRNQATKHVFYARTHNHSSMGIATGSTIVSTTFDVPAGIETGTSQIVVVANGISSAPVKVKIN